MPAKTISQTLGTISAVAALLILASADAPCASAAEKYKTLHKFWGRSDGHQIYGDVTFDKAGNLYGTTAAGGTFNRGTVFQLTPNSDGSWAETLLHSFNSDGKDGNNPLSGIAVDSAGNLYGLTESGGVYDEGTVFEVSPNGDGTWSESVLYSFYAGLPQGDLIFDSAGNLFGTTTNGGLYYKGSVFELSPNGDGTWSETDLHSFNQDGKDGYNPEAGVIFDPAGNLYGTTFNGGASDEGTVFELIPNGDGSWTENLLHSFVPNRKDGYWPQCSLVLDPAGNLYGTTELGGSNGGYGIVFRLSPNGHGGWKEKVLHSFGRDGKDGHFPDARLIRDAAGSLYGTTNQGGVFGLGTVFKMKPTALGGWTEIIMHAFTKSQGNYPDAGLTLDGKGNFYGTTNGPSSVFEIMP
jgi:uncharacterized repeat protein (TIGR03803 family)